ncbi:tail protein X [Burkholderia cenocepacia]|uniref:tail protein X n=1 Tax=Burkholderia cenocepacia TaxID=95486 RepID=UPI001AA186A9|nr:tail protein X [Burkholderia cenocepacia]MBO1856854.1 tail protein X [Burkholderia cenocepacia]
MASTIQAIRHVTIEGERWDTIAWNYYGDPTAYGAIIEANPAANITPTLPAGVVLLIPILTLDEQAVQQSTSDLPPWKQ